MFNDYNVHSFGNNPTCLVRQELALGDVEGSFWFGDSTTLALEGRAVTSLLLNSFCHNANFREQAPRGGEETLSKRTFYSQVLQLGQFKHLGWDS